jgi:hypothetical protein
MLKTKSIKNIDGNVGSQSSRVPAIGKFGASVSIANSSQQSSASKLRIKSFRGGKAKNTAVSNTNLNISSSKLSDKIGNSSVGSDYNEMGGQKKMKIKVKPRNFLNNTQKNMQKNNKT